MRIIVAVFFLYVCVYKIRRMHFFLTVTEIALYLSRLHIVKIDQSHVSMNFKDSLLVIIKSFGNKKKKVANTNALPKRVNRHQNF